MEFFVPCGSCRVERVNSECIGANKYWNVYHFIIMPSLEHLAQLSPSTVAAMCANHNFRSQKYFVTSFLVEIMPDF